MAPGAADFAKVAAPAATTDSRQRKQFRYLPANRAAATIGYGRVVLSDPDTARVCCTNR